MIPEKDVNEKMKAEGAAGSESDEMITVSSQISQSSQSSQSSIPEEEISIWVGEIEAQNENRTNLNEAIHSITDGRYSHL